MESERARATVTRSFPKGNEKRKNILKENTRRPRSLRISSRHRKDTGKGTRQSNCCIYTDIRERVQMPAANSQKCLQHEAGSDRRYLNVDGGTFGALSSGFSYSGVTMDWNA